MTATMFADHDPLLREFHAAGLLLPDEIGGKCQRCGRPMLAAEYAEAQWCGPCREETSVTKRDARRYWVTHGKDWHE